ncbi:MAG: hypothetical protein KAT30_08165, partial [Candidatus Krumholzibacteria bacterium]|nr:hypothetical protein [Candidatus Krumholzibacteria bacterium]
MKRLTIVAVNVAAAVLVAFVALGEARESAQKTPPRARLDNNLPVGADVRPDRIPAASSAIYDTTELGYWTFDQAGCDPQGWTSVDMTEQTGVYWHVDDFIGLGGGDFGLLVALEGNQSLWCGVRPDAVNPFLCGYATPPGYGNSWDQTFATTACLDVAGDVAIDFLVSWHSEPGYDYTYVEYDKCDDGWRRLFTYEGFGTGFASHVLADSLQLHDGNVRLRFHVTSDIVWSDEDGLWNTDGAVIIDSLT